MRRRDDIIYCMFFVGHAGNKIDEVWQQIARERGRRNGTKFCRLLEGDWCTQPPRPVTFSPEGPLGSQNIEGCKKLFVMLFSKVV